MDKKAYICYMEGKKNILSNIINYVSNNNIKVCDTVSEEIYTGNDYSPMKPLSPESMWGDISENFKFDSITIQLLENFKDSIEREDYSSASYMKKEISNRLVDVSELKETGIKLLTELKGGCYQSETFDYLTSDVNRLLNDFENGDSITNTLNELSTEINSVNVESIKEEIRNTIFDFNKENSHPSLMIERVVLFFGLIG